MSNARFTKIWTVGIVFILVLCLVLNIAANMFSAVLDSYLGRGEMHIEVAEGSEEWESEYYETSTESLSEAKEESNTVSEQITDEGIVLLKNDGALPLEEGTSVAPFGYGYMDPAYSGSGAASTTDSEMITVEEALNTYFTVNTATVEKMSSAEADSPGPAEGTSAFEDDVNSLQAMMNGGEAAKIYEYDPSIYSGTEASVKNSVGIVFIKRTGSEGIDKRYEAYDDGTPHYLALTANEKETIKFAKENCSKVIVILNISNPIELGPIMSGEYEADAIMLVGTAGSRGFLSMAKIMAGEVNPSGRLADIYPTDFTQDPTYVNFGADFYTNSTVVDTTTLDFIPGANKGTMDRAFVEYEEGIYTGYRYYETADIMDTSFVYGELDENGGAVTEGAVAYPFGYGLSYTTFEKKIADFQVDGDEILISVEVTNTGDVAGKDVVQIYYTTPYTEYGSENKVEKSTTVLQDFTKTDILEPGASETVTLQFSREDMASYDASHENEDGTTGCYLLEAGEYSIELKENSHTVIDFRTVEIENDIFYEGDNARQSEKDAQSVLDEDGNSLGYTYDGSDFVAASNQFDTLNEYMSDDGVTNLSRSDWTGTFPTAPDGEREAPQVALDEFETNDIGSFDVENDEKLGNTEGSLVYTSEVFAENEENGLSLIDMRGLDYNDEAWDALLDQIDWTGEQENIQTLLYGAAYQTAEVESVGKPATTDKDGAMGWSVDGAASWASASLMACTWNTDLMYEYGICIGEEALQAGLTGWYAPGVNLHRSQFGGRFYEYYSEDGLLSGKLAAAIVSGAGEKGVISYLKHFALNEQETYRSVSLATWATEQTMRELYLKPFELCVKYAKSSLSYISDDQGTITTKVIRSETGIMSAQNFIGGTMGFAHYGLLTNVLRNEWGFNGAVVTDLFPSSSESLRDMTIRAGSDMYMNQAGYVATDYESTTARAVMRNAMHNILYAVANSNAMNNIVPGTKFSYDMSLWRKLLIGIDIGIIGCIALILSRIILRRRDEKKNPEKYLKKVKRTGHN
ncbi:MAG: glycoside hydrolase family 3 C-terminal domain-containing protein [Clostridiales bacterium]|nr:glycoside hydrolase family 3 C-terminal domain-containing protein [Clostridiales bacterium]